MSGLLVVPLRYRAAKALIDELDPLFDAPPGMHFALGVMDRRGKVRGVLMCGRAVNRTLDGWYTCEVSRCATDGTRGAAALLYRRAARAAAELGYCLILAYTVAGEQTAPLRRAGFEKVRDLAPHSGWARLKRPRRRHLTDRQPRTRWQRILAEDLPPEPLLPAAADDPVDTHQMEGQLAFALPPLESPMRV
jgi:hypothetical protein